MKIINFLALIFLAFNFYIQPIRAEVDEAKFNKAEGYPPHPTNILSLNEKYRVGTMTGKSLKKLQERPIWIRPSDNPSTLVFENEKHFRI